MHQAIQILTHILTIYSTNYKTALKTGLYDFTAARDFYREATKAAGIGMHADLMRKYIELQALLLTVIAPHWSEHIWLEVLKKPSSIQHELYPVVPATDPALTAARDYVRNTSSSITSAEGAQIKRLAKGKQSNYDPKKDKKLTIYCALKYPAWQEKYIDLVRESFDGMALDMKAVSKKIDKAESKKAMPFVQTLKKSLDTGVEPSTVFERKLAFDEVEVLREMVPGLRQTLQKCVKVEVVRVTEGSKTGEIVAAIGGDAGGQREELSPASDGAIPGQPTFFFENV